MKILSSIKCIKTLSTVEILWHLPLRQMTKETISSTPAKKTTRSAPSSSQACVRSPALTTQVAQITTNGSNTRQHHTTSDNPKIPTSQSISAESCLRLRCSNQSAVVWTTIRIAVRMLSKLKVTIPRLPWLATRHWTRSRTTRIFLGFAAAITTHSITSKMMACHINRSPQAKSSVSSTRRAIYKHNRTRMRIYAPSRDHWPTQDVSLTTMYPPQKSQLRITLWLMRYGLRILLIAKGRLR